MIVVSVNDAITPMIAAWLKDNPRFMRSLSKSIGWYVQGRIKRLSNTKKLLSKTNWRERIPLHIRRKLDEEAPEAWWGQLRQAIGYAYQNDGSVAIGWTSVTAASEGRMQEFGAKKQVTPWLRRYFSKRGVPLKWSTKVLNVPARPLFAPTMEIIEPGIGEHVERQVRKYINKGGFRKKAGKGRKYQVFG